MTTTRTHFTFRVDTWTPDGESIVEHIAGRRRLSGCTRHHPRSLRTWPGTPITLRQRARVIEDSPASAPGLLVGACECTKVIVHATAEVRWLTHSRLKSHQYRCNLVRIERRVW